MITGPSCPDPGIPSNGRRYGSVFTSGQHVHYRCDKGFKFAGSSTRTCLQTGRWSGNETRCLGRFEVQDEIIRKLIPERTTKR